MCPCAQFWKFFKIFQHSSALKCQSWTEKLCPQTTLNITFRYWIRWSNTPTKWLPAAAPPTKCLANKVPRNDHHLQDAFEKPETKPTSQQCPRSQLENGAFVLSESNTNPTQEAALLTASDWLRHTTGFSAQSAKDSLSADCQQLSARAPGSLSFLL